jgi:hypothetical protein
LGVQTQADNLPKVKAQIGNTWTLVGPAPIDTTGAMNKGYVAGRVSAIATDLINCEPVIYVGGANGGIWTLDLSEQHPKWKPLTDDQPSLAIGSIAVDPVSHDIYVGTGEPNQTPDSYGGAGILKYTYKDKKWSPIQIAKLDNYTYTIGKVVIDPKSQNVVYAATSKGLYRSSDAGQTWGLWSGTGNNVLPSSKGTHIPDPVFDIAINPQDPTQLFAATDLGTYSSSDGGVNWFIIKDLPDYSHRAVLAIAPSQPKTIYTIDVGVDNQISGGYFSTTGGTMWHKFNNLPNFVGTQGDYDLVLAVDPLNPNNVYAGGIDIVRTKQGPDINAIWENITSVYGPSNNSGIHPDQHAIIFPDCQNGTECPNFYVGNDGGVYLTNNATVAASSVTYNNFNQLFPGLAIAEFYGGDTNSTGSVYIGGVQDNGVIRGITDIWRQMDLQPDGNSDGGYAVFDQSNVPDQVSYGAHFGASLQRSMTLNGPWESITAGITLPTGGINSYDKAPLHFHLDPTDNQHLLYPIGPYLYESFNVNTPQASAVQFSATIDMSKINGPYTTGVIDALGIGGGQMYIASGKDIYRAPISSLAHHSPTLTRIISIKENIYVSDITVDGKDPSKVYIASQGDGDHVLNAPADEFGVFEIDNATSDPNSVSYKRLGDVQGLLPSVPVNSIGTYACNNKTFVMAGTDIGVFIWNGTQWSDFRDNLPHTAIAQLVVNPIKVTVFTHGRSAWTAKPPCF